MQSNNKRKYRYFIYSVLAFLILIALSRLLFNKIRRPNIILISIDALRADHLSCYGYKRHTSPNIDSLAKEGTIFLQAIAPGTETSYSLPVVLTSTFSHSQGVKQWRDVLINPSAKTLAEILLDNGYNTALFSNAYPLRLMRGINRGFLAPVLVTDKDAKELTDMAKDWLKWNKSKKFFLWIHYFDPHAPYSPPEPYDSLYIKDELNTDDINIPIGLPDKIWADINNIPYVVAKNNITSVNYYICQYDGEIRYTDEQIGVLFDELKKLGLNKNTFIIITSDHGESLGEHGRYFQHGGLPFDTLLQVPLVFKYSPIIPKNIKIKEQVSSADILPTLLDILKIKSPKSIEGKSFFDLFKGQKDNYGPYVFSKCAASMYSLRNKKWKLIYLANSQRYYFYDLEHDKDELNDIKDIKKEEFDLLKKELNKWVENDKKKLVVHPRIPPFDKDTIDKLISLGYLQGNK